jgi:iron complex transport system substrate-binding protein
MDLRYARCFTIDYFEGGYQLACLRDGQRYLIVPAGSPIPEGLSGDIMPIEQPVGDVYLVASDTMCLFDALGALDRISVSGVERDDWYLPSARAAMDAGDIVYGGRYRSPDYELLLSRGVRLAVENTMINHAPEVREKLLELGIPVIVELSSYEDEPLARCEWVRFFGALTGEDELARQRFEEQVSQAQGVGPAATGKTVAFFYLNSNGAAVVRRPGDYVTKMIEQAGGVSAFAGLDEATAGSSSVTMQAEQFYAQAKDADVIIYNGSIDDSVDSLDALLEKSPLLADFKAVATGEVWVTEQNMYQQMMASGQIIADISQALTGSSDELTYLRRLD